jgi:hypothetical protein
MENKNSALTTGFRQMVFQLLEIRFQRESIAITQLSAA